MRRLAPLIACMWLVLAVAPGTAQEAPAPEPPAQPTEPAPPPVDPRFETPMATMETFLKAMNRSADPDLPDRERFEALRTAAETIELPSSAAAEAGPRAANRLYQIFNKIGVVQTASWPPPEGEAFTVYPWENLTVSPWSRDRQRARAGFTAVTRQAPDQRITIERVDGGEWKFSTETAEGLNAFYRKVEDLPDRVAGKEVVLTASEWVRLRMPAALRSSEFLTLELWQWIGLLVVIGVGLVLDLIVRSLLGAVWRRVMRRREREADAELLRRAVRPFGLLGAAVLWFFALRLLGMPPGALVVLLAAVRVFLMLAAVWAAYRLTDLGCEYLGGMADRTETKFDDLLVPLVRKTLKVFVTAGGVIYIANAFEIEILPLLTGLGIGGLAFAFAAKDTIENFFGSVAVILDRPFEVGDWVVIDEVEGTVESMGIRSTRVRTFYNSLVSVPNATLVRARVDNYGRRRFRRFKTHVGLTYDTPPEKVEAFCAGVREIIRLHPYTRKDYYHVWLNGWGPSSLDVLVYMFHECPDWATELRERHRFMLDVMRLADRLGVSFAFPTQTLHLYKEEHGEQHTPADAPGTDAETQAQGEGLEAARAVTADQPWGRERPGVVDFATPHSELEAGMDESES